jgi:hypothetical protein
VLEENTRRQRGEHDAGGADVPDRPVLAPGVPLVEQLVHDLCDPVVNRVAKAS